MIYCSKCGQYHSETFHMCYMNTTDGTYKMKNKLIEEDARNIIKLFMDWGHINCEACNYNAGCEECNLFLLKKEGLIKKSELEQEVERLDNFVTRTINSYGNNPLADDFTQLYDRSMSIINKLQDKIKEIEK